MSKGKPVSRDIAMRIAKQIEAVVRPYSILLDICGSLRRGKGEVSDIDIVALPKIVFLGENPFFIALKTLGFKGKTRWERTWPSEGSHLKIEVNIAKSVDEWGSQLLHHTGPYQFNILLRGLAKQKGWKLSQYGLFDASDRRIAGASESEVLKMLGLRMIYPEERDDVNLRAYKRSPR